MERVAPITSRKPRLDDLRPSENSVCILNVAPSAMCNGFPAVFYVATVDSDGPAMELNEYWVRPPKSWMMTLDWDDRLPYLADLTPEALAQDSNTTPPGLLAARLHKTASRIPIYVDRKSTATESLRLLNSYSGQYQDIPTMPLVSLIPDWPLLRREADKKSRQYGLTPYHPRSMLLLQVDAYLQPKGLTLWDFLFETTE